MSIIYAAYTADPGFPATDQNASATRYTVSGYYVDASGGEPTALEVSTYLAGISDGVAGNLLKFDEGGGLSTAEPGVDYVAPGSSGGAGIYGGTY